jgi:hypothetical protein
MQAGKQYEQQHLRSNDQTGSDSTTDSNHSNLARFETSVKAVTWRFLDNIADRVLGVLSQRLAIFRIVFLLLVARGRRGSINSGHDVLRRGGEKGI